MNARLHPELRTLAAAWLASLDVAAAVSERLAAGERRAAATEPPYPEACRLPNHQTGELWEPGHAWMVAWSGYDWGARILAAYDAWSAEVEANAVRHGLPELERADGAAWARCEQLAAEILVRPVTTAADAAIKFAVLLWRCRDGRGGFDQPAPVFAFTRDLVGLAAAQPAEPADAAPSCVRILPIALAA